MILLPSPRQRIARLPLLFRAHDCLDDVGLFALSYGQKVYAVHTRAGVATAEDNAGRLIRVPSGMPRLSHVLINGARRPALILEGTGANAQVQYDDLSNAAWTKTACTVSANVARGPLGGLTADKIVEDGTNAQHHVSPAVFTPTANTLQSVVLWLAAAERTWAWIQTRDLAGATAVSWVNLATAAAGTVAGAHQLRVTAAGHGLVRVELSWNANSGASTCNVFVGPATGDGVSSYAGDGASGIVFGGLQRETDAQAPTSLMPSAAGAGARVADALYWPYRQAVQDLTMFVRFGERLRGGLAAPATVGHAYIGAAGGGDPRALLYRAATETGFRFQHDPATGSATNALGAPVLGDAVSLRGVIGTNGAASLGVSINDGAEATTGPATAQALGAAWADARFWLNSLGSSNVAAGAYTHAAIAPSTITRAELYDLGEVG